MANVIIKPSDRADAPQPTVGWSSGDMHDPQDGLQWVPLAKETLALLLKHYPGYEWFVEIRAGLMMIKNFTLDWRGRMCMVRRLDVMQANAGFAAREIVRMGGEFLERANMARKGRQDGDFNTQLDGADKWAPTPGTT